MADMGKDPADLVRRLQAAGGDEETQRELHERYRSRLVGFCGTRLDDPGSAEDCAQEVFQDVFAGIGELRAPEAFESWMFTIAARKIRSYNGRLESTAPPGDNGIPDLPDPVTDVERDVRMRELLDTITDAVESLPSPLNAVMKAFISGGGLRGSELAPRFGWDAKKADHELNRARTGLFAALETLVVVRTGRGACSQLNTLCTRQRIRPGRVARLSQDQRRTVHRHITQCGICGPQASAARDRGQWALGPGIAQLADHLNRRRPGTRLVAAAAVLIAAVALPSASDLVPPEEANRRPAALAPPAPSAPPATRAPSPSASPRTNSPAPHAPPAVPPPKGSRPAVPVANGGDDGGGGGPGGGGPGGGGPGGGGPGGGNGGSPSPPRTPVPSATPSTPSTPSPPIRPACTTTIALDPLTVRVNAILFCVSVTLGR
jgi:DNA-directed RNA polymerase specialized sigma24 family protein